MDEEIGRIARTHAALQILYFWLWEGLTAALLQLDGLGGGHDSALSLSWFVVVAVVRMMRMEKSLYSMLCRE